MFSIDGAANRFFFISKGKTRNTHDRPLYRLFEQISPVNTNNGSHATDNFINDMRNGNSYLCYHDCADVGTVDNGHWFTISQSGEAFSLNNLTIFIPDRRLEDNRGNNQNQANSQDFYCFYGGRYYNHTAVMPKVLMYTASLEATATPSETTNGYYQVNLKWDTSFTPEKLGVDVPQHYYVYILNEDNTRTLIEDVAKDPVNNLVVTKHHDYLIQQTTDPQTIKYVIEAQTINYDNDGQIIYKDGKPLITLQAESPVRTITIPGYSPFFTQVSEYRSRYDVTHEVNIYKNKLSIRPTSAEDFVAIKNNQEKYNVTRTDANGEKVTIATVKFTQQEGQESYDYIVNYNAETQVTEEGLVFDNEVPSTHGTINDFAGSTVFVIDRFTASTQTNEQSDKYTYKFEQNEGNYSNPLTVPVYKTTSTVNGVGYTNAQITSDTDHSLRAAPCNEITFHAIYDPSANLSDYYVYRLGDKDNYAVGKAEHFNNNGEYHVYVVGTDGHLNVQTGIQHFTQEGGDITVTDQNQSVADEESRYVPVITTHYGGDQNKPNTYGCDIKSVSYPQVKLAVKGMMKTDPFAGSTGPMLGYLVKLGITPKLPRKSDINYVYYYRLWRVVENQEGAPTQFSNEILLNLEENNSGQNAHGQTLWASDYDDLRDFYPGNDDKQVDDIFLDWVFNGKKEVKYIVRLYATSIAGEAGDAIDQIPDPSPAPAIATPKANDGKDYFIAEDIIIITFNNGTPTAVGTINVEAQPVSVTYYNMLGVGSSRPHPGVNVMVTRYNDGTTSTTKVIR